MNDTPKPSAKNFNLVVLGQIISVFGAALLRFALSLHVLAITGSEVMFASLFALSSIPLLLGPLGGAIADRFNRRDLMVIFDFSSSAIIFSLLLLLPVMRDSVVLIAVVMILLSVISALYTPAVTASIPLLVDEKKLVGANGIVQAVQALSQAAAPVLGGVLFNIMGVQRLVVFSCAAFFLSAVMEIFIKIPFEKRELYGHIVPAVVRDMKEGFIYVFKQSFILKAMILAALLNLILTPLIIVGAPIIFYLTMQSGNLLYGIGMGTINFATILGALTVGIFAKRIRINTLYRLILGIAILLLPIALSVMPIVLGLGLYPPFMLFMLCVVPIAMILTITSIFVVTAVQKKTSNEYLGKVMAIIMAAAQCTSPAGQFVYGILFREFSRTVYIPILLVSAVMFVITFISRRMLKNEEA
ncbi:MAG: MFS transporter [Treponema sp.]|jgi:MFS family permease|nr:MFS transporter [Treponema sp.]